MYEKLPVGTHQPGFILLMLEHSGSMSGPYAGGQSKPLSVNEDHEIASL
jgi:hypothetical protein